MLNLIAVSDPARGRQWVGVRGRFSDLPTSHLAYGAVSTAVASGAMTITSEGAFAPTRPVTGAEAVAAINRVRTLGRFPANPSERP